MIHNLSRLYDGCPPGIEAYHRLRLIEWFLLKPLGEVWGVTITGAYRTTQAQAALTVAQKAKGTSQHTLGEAIDFVPDGSMSECYTWCLDNLRPYQALLEYGNGRPICIHLSIPSVVDTIVSKRLLFVDGLWRPFAGVFPVQA